ncbi:transglycosylase SLT domain-containing protein [Gemmatimonadota bacterium]
MLAFALSDPPPVTLSGPALQAEEPNPALEAGLSALRDGDPSRAVTLLRSSATSEDALSGEAWIGLGVAYRTLGRPTSAVEALARSEALVSEPLLGWIRFERARILIDSGEMARADSLLVQIASSTAEVPVIERVQENRLDRAVAGGDEELERDLIESLVELGTGNAARHAARLAELVQTDDREEAGRLRRLSLELPGSDEARGRSVVELLSSSESMTSAELIEAGRILFGLADWQGSVGALRRALEQGGTGAEVSEARYRLGLSLYRMRSYSEAATVLTEAEASSAGYRTSSAYYAALSISASSNRRVGADALVSFADRYPGSRWAPRTLKQAGDRLLSTDREAAGQIYARLIAAHPTYWENAKILFSLGEGARDAGELDEAREWFVELGRGLFYPQEKAQGWFWAARMAEASGDSATAAGYFERGGDRYPYTYYGARALRELGRPLPESPVTQLDTDAGSLVVPDWVDTSLEAGIVLIRTGLTREGETQLLHSVSGRSFTRERLYDLWTVSVEGRAYTAATRLGDRLLDIGGWDEEDPRYWNLLFPLYFVDLIEPVAQQNELDPYLILALIKQESAFLPDARSYVGARGLMQLMPETAEEWRNRLRLPPMEEEDLYDPAINLSLGIPYFAHLVDRFEGSTEKALAAYNGGATNVRRWERGLTDNRPETFIESIGYPETRTFVLTIMNNYYRYQYLRFRRAE